VTFKIAQKAPHQAAPIKHFSKGDFEGLGIAAKSDPSATLQA
jgi:hypothetical protein